MDDWIAELLDIFTGRNACATFKILIRIAGLEIQSQKNDVTCDSLFIDEEDGVGGGVKPYTIN